LEQPLLKKSCSSSDDIKDKNKDTTPIIGVRSPTPHPKQNWFCRLVFSIFGWKY
jgi:hypothetical protein